MALSPEAKQARSDYRKAWGLKNRDKVRQYNENYWQRMADSKASAIDEGEECSQSELESRVISLHKKGLSLREIGKLLDISHMKVKRILEGCNSL